MEELEINSANADYINNFNESWKEYSQFAKLGKVTFTWKILKYQDFKELQKSTRKYFRQFRKYKDSLICSGIIPAVHPYSSEEYKFE